MNPHKPKLLAFISWVPRGGRHAQNRALYFSSKELRTRQPVAAGKSVFRSCRFFPGAAFYSAPLRSGCERILASAVQAGCGVLPLFMS